jgi:hypothetical protein
MTNHEKDSRSIQLTFTGKDHKKEKMVCGLVPGS